MAKQNKIVVCAGSASLPSRAFQTIEAKAQQLAADARPANMHYALAAAELYSSALANLFVAIDRAKAYGAQNIDPYAVNLPQRDAAPDTDTRKATEGEGDTGVAEEPAFKAASETAAADTTTDSVRRATPGGSAAEPTTMYRSIEAINRRMAAGNANWPKLIIVDNWQSAKVDEAVRNAVGKKEGQPVAAYHRGVVYVNERLVSTERDIVEAIAHEVLGHHGLRGVFRTKLNEELDALAAKRPDLINKFIKQYKLDEPMPDGTTLSKERQRRIAAEEALAWLAQTQPKLNIVQKAIAKIREILRGLFGDLFVKTYSDNDIIAKFILPARDWVRNGARHGVMPDGRIEPSFILAGVRSLAFGNLDRNTVVERFAKLDEAKKMARAGETAELIWSKTGWWRGPDGGWRFEIPDAGAEFAVPFESLEIDKDYRLGDVLRHDQLFAAYPSLKDVTFVRHDFDKGGGGNLLGVFYRNSNTIELNKTQKNPLSVLLHEIQHWVQAKEGFAGGANASVFSVDIDAIDKVARYYSEKAARTNKPEIIRLAEAATMARKNASRLQEVKQRVDDLDAALAELKPKIEALESDLRYAAKSPKRQDAAARNDELRALKKRRAELIQEIAKAKIERDKLLKGLDAVKFDVSRGLYALSAGEVEAFNVERRLNMTAEARASKSPSETQTVPSDLQILSMSGDAAFKLSDIEVDDTGRTGVPLKLVEKLKNVPFGLRILDFAYNWKTDPVSLGALTLTQIADRFPQFGHVDRAVRTWLRMGARATQLMRPSSDVHRRWAAYVRRHRKDGMADRLHKAFITSTLAGAWVDGDAPVLQDPRNSHILGDENAKSLAIEAKKLYLSLDKDGRELYSMVIKDLDRQFRAKLAALRKYTAEAFREAFHEEFGVEAGDANLDALMSTSSPEERNEIINTIIDRAGNKSARTRQRVLLNELSVTLEAVVDDLKRIKGPYFPLSRSGNYVVVFKSDAYKKAEKAYEEARATFARLKSDDTADETAVTKAYNDLREAANTLRTLKQRSNDYIVEFFDTRIEADARAAELGPGAYSRVRRAAEHETDSVPHGFITQLEHQIRKNMPKELADDVASAVRQMVVSTLPERSALKAELRRMSVTGASPDKALASYVSVSHRNAWATSRLEFSTDISRAINNAFASDIEDERMIANELVRRYASQLRYTPANAAIDAAVGLSYMYHLGASPFYWVQNMTQPWLVTLPFMSDKHGMRRAVSELVRATEDAIKVVRATIKQTRSVNDLEMKFDLDSISDPDERKLIEELLDEGAIDITIRADLSSSEAVSTNPVLATIQHAAHIATLPAHLVESVNRLATALAAHRLEKAKLLSERQGLATPPSANEINDRAGRYARWLIDHTHLNYAVENAPRYMNPNLFGGLGRMAFQFRRYQQGMVFLWLRTLYDSFVKGDARARRTLAYWTGITVAATGLSGLPIAAPLALAVDLIGDALSEDDEERDWATWLWAGVRDVLGGNESEVGKLMADVAQKGTLALVGLDVSKRLGMGDIFSPVYNMPRGDTGQEVFGNYAAIIFGAAGAMTAAWIDAAMIADDNPGAAMAKAMPVALLRNVITAVDRTANGIRDRRGNVIMTEDELSAFDNIIRGIGADTTKVTQMYETRNAVREQQVNRDEARRALMRAYTRARINGDNEKMSELMDRISEFNVRHPDARITYRHLAASYREETRRRAELRSGVRVNKRNEDIAEEYM